MTAPTDTPAPAGRTDRFREAFGDWTPRAVVFDCDGLLLDTETVWYRVQEEMLGRLDARLEPGDAERLHGSTLEVAAEIMAERAGADYEEVLAETRALFLEHLRGDELRVLPGAAAVVAAAASRVPIACASNSWHAALEEKLERAGLREHFSVLHSTDTVERAKPDPEMYERGARDLGAEPAQALAFEDSPTGARAATGAGLRLVAVPERDIAVPGAAITLGSLDDADLLSWIATWPSRGDLAD
ncbi:HAD family hydrolase [Brachybacterium huguangmaarense]